MNYSLIKDLVQLAEDFESQNEKQQYSADLDGLKQWLYDGMKDNGAPEPVWEGKENGRSAESVINTLIVHMNRYAKTYSRAAMHGSAFSTQEEFIYLINLKAFGPMGKMELIKKNIQDKPVGMQIINRLLQEGWVAQRDSETDKRSKIIRITQKGLKTLERQMEKIRQATRVVTGDLTHPEKMELIRLLDKLDRFHHPIFSRNIDSAELLECAGSVYLQPNTQDT
jgi:DNA-binding MarR family transcriptional regulator